MRTRQVNKLDMYLAVRRSGQTAAFIRARNEVPALRQAWDDYLAVLDELFRQAKRAQAATGGATAGKAALREALATSAARISAGFVTWAEDRGELELARSTHLTRSTLLNGRAIEAAVRAEALLAQVQAHAAELSDYGLRPAAIEAFDRLTRDFAEASGRPRSIITERKLARASLRKLFAEADRRLARIDRLTSLLSSRHAALVASYHASRKIVHTAASRKTREASPAPVTAFARRPAPLIAALSASPE